MEEANQVKNYALYGRDVYKEGDGILNIKKLEKSEDDTSYSRLLYVIQI